MPNQTAFFEHVADDVDWTIEGTHPLAGRYTNKTILEATFLRIDQTASKTAPFRLSIVNIVGGCDEEWSVQELQLLGICKSGK